MIIRKAIDEDVGVLCALNKVVHDKHTREVPWNDGEFAGSSCIKLRR